jgi:hypothetical protein
MLPDSTAARSRGEERKWWGSRLPLPPCTELSGVVWRGREKKEPAGCAGCAECRKEGGWAARTHPTSELLSSRCLARMMHSKAAQPLVHGYRVMCDVSCSRMRHARAPTKEGARLQGGGQPAVMVHALRLALQHHALRQQGAGRVVRPRA